MNSRLSVPNETNLSERAIPGNRENHLDEEWCCGKEIVSFGAHKLGSRGLTRLAHFTSIRRIVPVCSWG
jgi:hypothetical protein